jgi:hypothetical protein
VDAVDAEQLTSRGVGQQLASGGVKQKQSVSGADLAALLDLGDPGTFLRRGGATQTKDDLDVGGVGVELRSFQERSLHGVLHGVHAHPGVLGQAIPAKRSDHRQIASRALVTHVGQRHRLRQPSR